MKKTTAAVLATVLFVAAGWGVNALFLSEEDAPDERRAAGDADGASSASGDAKTPRLAGRDPASAPLPPPPPSPDPAPATKENSIHGRVVGLDGRPIRGVIVTARSDAKADPMAPLDLSVMRSETDVDGTYLAGPLLDGAITIHARGEGLVSVTRTVPARGARVDLVMEPAYEIALVVFDTRGARVGGARVTYVARADSLASRHEVEDTTDAKGTVRIAGVLDEPGGLTARSPEHGSVYVPIRPGMFARPGSETWTTITLPDRARVEGVVVDKATGAPIQGAVVTVGTARPRARLQTDAQGRFEARADLGRSLRVPVRAHALGYRAGRASIERPAAAGSVRVRIELESAEPLRGVVETGDGEVLAGATVMVAAGRVFHDLDTQTDARGRFALARPEDRSPKVSGPMPEHLRARLLEKHRIPIAARHPEHGHGIVGVPLRDVEKDIEIRLSGVGEVTGTVQTASGEPAVGAIVTLVPPWKESRRVESEADRLQEHLWATRVRPSAVTDARGAFRVPRVPAAVWRVEARWGEDLLAVAPIRVVHRGTHEVALTLDTELTIRGHIRDQFGTPVPGVVILPMRDEIDVEPATHSRSDGSFVIRGLTAGTYVLLLEGKNMHLPNQPQVTAGAQDVDIRVERSVPFRVVVTHEGRPYTKRFSVEVLDRHPPKPSGEGMVKVGPFYRLKIEAWGPKGECTVSGLPPGAYRVRIRTKEGLQSEDDTLITLTAGVPPGDVHFDLRAP